ncbi:MAG: HEAT repeat domain-containing protein [Promethearchaeota archaeon]
MNEKFSPLEIYERFRSDQIDAKKAVQMLLFLIENSESQDVRKDCVNYLGKVTMGEKEEVVAILVNLMLSDYDNSVRLAAATVLKNNHPLEAIEPMRWMISHEPDYDCSVAILELLGNINNIQAKLILIDKLQQIVKIKIVNKREKHQLVKYQKALVNLIEESKVNNLHHEELSEILVNYSTIDALIDKFVMVHYELDNCLVEELDLSELQNNFVFRGQPYPTEISSINDIIGLYNLKRLKSLNISNNRIFDLRPLVNLKGLEKLNLSRNALKEVEDIIPLKEMKSLKILNLSGNDVLGKLNLRNFINMEVITYL